jgi:hypothetical protein
LASANQVAFLGQLSASIAEINQPISAVVMNAEAALRLLLAQPTDTVAVRRLLACIVKDGMRAGDIVDPYPLLHRRTSIPSHHPCSRPTLKSLLGGRRHRAPAVKNLLSNNWIKVRRDKCRCTVRWQTLRRRYPLSFDQFRYAFVNAVSEQEAKELYEAFAVPAAGTPLFQAATANLNRWTEARVAA